MSTFELAFPARNELSHKQRSAKSLRLAKLAVAAASHKAKEKALGLERYSPQELEARNQAGENVAALAAPIVEILAHRMGEAHGVKALRATPAGEVVSLEYMKKTVVSKKTGKERHLDPNKSWWELAITSPDDKTKQTFQINMNHPATNMPPEIKVRDKNGKEHHMYDYEIDEETDIYNEIIKRLNFLAAGFKDKSLLVQTLGEQPIADVASLDVRAHHSRARLVLHRQLAHVS